MNSIELTNTYVTPTYNRIPVVFEKAEGYYIYDQDGKKYLDFTAGIGVNSLGYHHPDWVEATQKQLSQLQHISNLYYTEPSAQVAEKLCLHTGMQHVLFVNSGAESNEIAIKVARKYGHEQSPDKHKILTLSNSFHGRTVTTLSATGQDTFHKFFDPFTEGFDFIETNSITDLHHKVDQDVCAIMIEIVQGEGGVVPLESDFIQAIADICNQKNILLIIDEVQTGIGRTGKLFAYEHYGLQPDIVTSAKGLGNGLPIGAAILGEKVKDVLEAGDHGSTFGGNPVVTAGANVVLETLTPAFLEKVHENSLYLIEKLEALDEVEEVTGLGLMIGITFKHTTAKEVLSKAKEEGVLFLTAKDKLRLLPPLIIDKAAIDEAVNCLDKVLKKEEAEVLK
ncbi:aspartate aminotransferase family protein [Marinilactibacillus psychrotolerans]|uniref:Acetylornithine aminotransferase n=1 Tax=Marinilactibacillus psychrotolerans TaxID=191770 RepID=A0AAV3WA21_9LACT|nr:aspartate aminotransferase family protein [Marinilactibacillus psychrotolerans]GEL67636.1 acetylornithine aminotransferase [Marinilactibacillus psychrotolerans]GEQ36506.1 acetylornithine aminotransferase [Marinilactibacillus psychrotolerans]SDD12921.1 acetylornithine/N-succinyldiaminopimelate aminotransferase [Marinilactibacillus psychrotolerans]